ncbi:hypothetical protein H5410_061048, partial [Solanum commersonii]
EKIKLAMKRSSGRVAEQFYKAAPHRLMIQNAKIFEGKRRRHFSVLRVFGDIVLEQRFEVVLFELNGIVVANTISSLCFWLVRERGFKTKITKSIACGYWVVMGSNFERVNPRPSHI